MTKQQLDLIGGEVVFWTATMTETKTLKDICHEWFVSITPHKALLMTVQDHYRKTDVMIRKGHGSTVIVTNERQLADGNDYSDKEHQSRYEIDPTTWAIRTLSGAAIDEQAAQKYRGMTDGANAGIGISRMASKRFDAISLRSNGGVYFVPKAQLDRFHQVVSQLETETGIRFSRVSCSVDDNTATAIADASRQAMLDEAQDIINAITQCDDSEKGKRKRDRLMKQITDLKRRANELDAGFQGLTTVAKEVASQTDTMLALAVLATAE